MKLAQALNERAALQEHMNELAARLCANARVQEGLEPSEDPVALFGEYNDCAAQLEMLVTRINRTNSETTVDGVTLTALLAKRDCLKLRVQTYSQFLREAGLTIQRARGTEIRQLPAVPVAQYRKILDELSKELRTVDGTIQAANWTVELL